MPALYGLTPDPDDPDGPMVPVPLGQLPETAPIYGLQPDPANPDGPFLTVLLADAPADPVGVFGTTAAAVYRLAPEAERIVAPDQGNVATPITQSTVVRWIQEVEAIVDVATHARTRITDQAQQDRLSAAARTVIANGAASYMEAARYPVQAGTNESAYHQVLWQRYQTGLTALTDMINGLIKDGGAGITTTRVDGPFHTFPAPAYDWPGAVLW